MLQSPMGYQWAFLHCRYKLSAKCIVTANLVCEENDFVSGCVKLLQFTGNLSIQNPET